MALLTTVSDTILLAAKREVKFFNSDGTNVQHLLLPAFDPKNTKQSNDIEDDDERSEEPAKRLISQKEESVIQNIAVSPNGHLLVITTTGDKLVYTYKILATEKQELVSKRTLPRISSAIAFSSDSKYFYIADKTGDCYEFSCENVDLAGKWILGHLSMVLDVLATQDLRFIITCDRDEKIRVTNYPATHLIETYCLGHTEYVSAISFLPTNANQVLVSVSGDKMLKIWSYIDGVLLFDYALPSAGLKMILRKINETTSHVAVTLYKETNLIICEIEQASDQTFTVKLISEHNFKDCKEITSLVFENDGNILLASVNTNNSVDVQRLIFTSDKYVECDSVELNKNLGDMVLDLQYNFENISMLFKKRYDNIKDYHERKKRRIEDQKQNSYNIL
ncbi:tRNA (guanine-N(7)-)-methyltransferase non-catalytic subunit wuho [Pseudolycoriella hygida]|uniref:tRNA (Guanine-N(7)-)-methyltransferase non-catalytic subunit wuho n=1 Tax=Pseudolycoriella hygida TaxID=35572 RepID=A0A9Q0RVE6_9DIPT|nr:tRNA (guanine-N(7)-)-methyltransferase non-catalytic subunit wuho [Pseudolycoriella hygida]